MPGVVATEWLTVLFGVLLVIAPWVLTYTDRVGASWTSWAVGIIAVALGGSAVPASNQAARQRRYPTAGIPARSYGLSALARSDRSSASATRAAGTRTSAPHRPRAARRGRARRRPWPSGPSREGRWGTAGRSSLWSGPRTSTDNERMGDRFSVPLTTVRRSRELGRVLAALERAAAGSGGALLLAGEAGIGKSRLAAEALSLASQRGFVTLQGSAYPLQADLAYAPVLEVLGPFLAGLEPGRRAALVGGLPDLGRLFAGLHLPPPEPLGDAALERTRLFEAVSRLVERVAADRPVALLVDDLHWADAASLELLHYLARGLGVRRVLLLGTYRLDEARTHPGLRELVRSLQRLGLAEELPVGGLSPEAVAALAGALLGGEPPAALLGALRERAAGMPLFVTALIRGLRDTGELFRSGGAWVLGSGSLSAVPPVVRDLVLVRLERLDPADRALLELVAVAGDAAFLAILGRVGGPAEGELDAAA